MPYCNLEDVIEMAQRYSPSEVFSIFSKALEIQDEASRYGFEWDDVSGILDKIREEAIEIEKEVRKGDLARLKKEIGDLYMVALHLAQFLGLDPLECLRISCNTFERRWRKVLENVKENLPDDKKARLEYLESVWQSVKGFDVYE